MKTSVLMILLFLALTSWSQSHLQLTELDTGTVYAIDLIDGPLVLGKVKEVDSLAISVTFTNGKSIRVQKVRINDIRIPNEKDKQPNPPPVISVLKSFALDKKTWPRHRSALYGELGYSLWLAALSATINFETRVYKTDNNLLEVRGRIGYGISNTWSEGDYNVFPVAATSLVRLLEASRPFTGLFIAGELNTGVAFAFPQSNQTIGRNQVYPLVEMGLRISTKAWGPMIKFKTGTAGTHIGIGVVF